MHGGLGCSNIVSPPALRMLNVNSSFLNHGDGDYVDEYSHGFIAPPGRFLTPDERYVGLVRPGSTVDTGGDQNSAVTNMSNITSASGEASGSSGGKDAIVNGGGRAVHPLSSSAATCGGLNSNGLTVVVKRKRNLPGTPDPEAEVVALSPKTLMATNRFVCEICNKGFQRDQNLQLHRRGHNLPWKLKQRSSKEIRKRVYICPESSCVHHDPARALGDLTGIKKHFCRKHGEKKWKCDKCSKRYAVQSDWKAHSKTCGTREYRCDCGTLFSRRDSFITHRAFCDALAEESARVSTGGHLVSGAGMAAGMMMGGAHPPGVGTLSRVAGIPGSGVAMMDPLASATRNALHLRSSAGAILENSNLMPSRPRLSLWLGSGPHSNEQNIMGNDNFSVDPFGSALFASHSDCFEGPKQPAAACPPYGNQLLGHAADTAGLSGLAELGGFPGSSAWTVDKGHTPASLNSINIHASAAPRSGLAGLPSVPSLLGQAHATSSAQTSATALLQKAAQMGATASNPALLKGFGNTLLPVRSNTLTSTWLPTSASLGGSYQGFIPSMAMHNQLSMQQKSTELDVLKSTLSALKGGGDQVLKTRTGSFMDVGGSDTNIHELMSTMAPATGSSLSGSSNAQLNSSINHFFGANSLSNSENRNSNPSVNAADNAISSRGQHQQQYHANLGMMGIVGNVPKSEDGVTRDFLGVRGVNALMRGVAEHTSAASIEKSQDLCSTSVFSVSMDSPSLRDRIRPLSCTNSQPSPNRSWGDTA